jgi:maleylpyruvate isomerase
MTRSLADALRWTAGGTKVFLGAVAGLTEEDFDAPTLLPGWTRRHLAGHVAANADALGHLVHWAATGEVTPMYGSPQERADGIERAAAMSGSALTGWLHGSATALEKAITALSDQHWTAQVTTAQGRTVSATEIPWMRAREIWVHAVDLGCGVGFSDLPGDLLGALVSDVRAKRGAVPEVAGPLAEVAAWLTGRPHMLAGAPALDPWL